MQAGYAADIMPSAVKHFESILNTMTDGIYITARDGKTVFVNKAYEQLSGLSASYLHGKHVQSLTQEGIFNTALNPVIVSTREPASTVQKLGEKNVILHGFPIFENDEVSLVVTFVRDITTISRLYEQVSQQEKQISEYHERLSFISGEQNRVVEAELLQSQCMQDLLAKINVIARTDASMLITGETGTGKDVLARMSHNLSSRSDKIFLKVDCSSISEQLIESELFGYVSGAFSGAASKGKPGYFEAAEGGTVMLDEIGELPLPMQSKFLRVLQDAEIIRVGDNITRKVDVRIIAVTNINLEDAVKRGKFRKDLYYRLNVVSLHVPPLRERKADIRPLIQYFLEMYRAKYHHKTTFSEQTVNALEEYGWPGNVRELQNLIQSLVLGKNAGIILPEHLPPHIYTGNRSQASYSCTIPNESTPLHELISNMEQELLRETIKRLGSINKAADFFQINRSTIFRKLNNNSTVRRSKKSKY